MKIIIQDDEGKTLKTVELDAADIYALDTDIMSVPEWIENAITAKAAWNMDEIVTRSGMGSKFTALEGKKEIILKLKQEGSPLLKTAQMKEAEREVWREAQKNKRDAARKAAREN